MSSSPPVVRGGEYAARGDYHREPDPSWDYYPTYLAKLAAVRAWLDTLPRSTRVLDAGCGEGVLVSEYAGRLAIEGVDAHYSSERVHPGSVTALPYGPGVVRPCAVPRRARAPDIRGTARRPRRTAPCAAAGRRTARVGAQPRPPAVPRPFPPAGTPHPDGVGAQAPWRSTRGRVHRARQADRIGAHRAPRDLSDGSRADTVHPATPAERSCRCTGGSPGSFRCRAGAS